MDRNTFRLIMTGCVALYVLAMFNIPLIDIDAAQYASISREMMENGSFLKVYDLRSDWIDKPPMLFWTGAISLKLFGVHDWAYRLPSVLFLLLGIYATYKLAMAYYGEKVAQLAAIVLASSQAVFLMSHDVRCDTMLLGWVMFSFWQLDTWYRTRKWIHFIAGFVAIAGGMMTKGPIALMLPVWCFLPHFALRREWKQFLRWEYLIGLIIVALLLLPMSIGLYRQFDLEPGKLYHGQPIQSGLRFFYWTQSFGRYTGENVFNEMNHFTFLLENMMWSFLPWIIFFLIGLVHAIKQIIEQRFRIGAQQEFLTTGGFILTYCVLARSQAQLPHYIFVVLPLAAIITAVYMHRLWYSDTMPRLRKVLHAIHVPIYFILCIAALGLMVWPFPDMSVVLKVLGGVLVLAAIIQLVRPIKTLPATLGLALITVMGVNLLLNTGFYPRLLQYQLGNTVAKLAEEKQLDKQRMVLHDIDESRALHFYGDHIFERNDTIAGLRKDQIVITRKTAVPALKERYPGMNVIFDSSYFGVSMLTLPFLNPAQRKNEVTPYVIVDLAGHP